MSIVEQSRSVLCLSIFYESVPVGGSGEDVLSILKVLLKKTLEILGFYDRWEISIELQLSFLMSRLVIILCCSISLFILKYM